MTAPNLNDRIAGLLYGSFVADSLALGAHWIYDQGELQQTFGRVTEFLDPRENSYHPKKKRGQQTHYGDQAITLMNSLRKHGGFDFDAFARDWQSSWDGYPDYFDHATKDTLQKLKAGVPAREAASSSNELGGASRIAPLLALMAKEPVDSMVAAVLAQTSLTHGAKIASDAAEFLSRITAALLAGGELHAAIEEAGKAEYRELDVPAIMQQIEGLHSMDTAAAAKTLGLACPAPQAIPTLLLLLDRYGDDFEKAVIENVMAGGDNAARALALGMILGAAHGKSQIPARWIERLEAAPRIDAFLSQL